jgi:long-chain acyl-CoA synthetase
VEVRIAPDGEILVRGPNVFQGYYKDEEATREAISEGGWFHTGDIGEFDAQGMLVITDRKKDLIVTAGGKNVAPQKVEGILKRDRYIAEAMLYGDRRPFITALVVPDFGWIVRYAKWKGISYEDRCELVKNPRIVDFIARRIDKMQEEAHLAPYETVKKFVLLDHEFSPREGEVTPTMKIRRKQITEHYKRELDALYEKDK